METLFWLIPSKLAGRAGPVMQPWNLDELRAAGITTIVSTDEDCHAETIGKSGLKHLRHFMPQTFPTTPELVDHFIGLVHAAARDVIAEIKAGGCVLIHCYAGRDRTGLVLCATLMDVEGLDAEDALKRVRKVRPQALTGPGILNVLREYESRHHR